MVMTNAALIGYWKITKMDVWNASYVDLVVPGFIEFEMEDDHLMGQFQFGTVSGGSTVGYATAAASRTSSGHGKVEATATLAAAAAGRILKTESRH